MSFVREAGQRTTEVETSGMIETKFCQHPIIKNKFLNPSTKFRCRTESSQPKTLDYTTPNIKLHRYCHPGCVGMGFPTVWEQDSQALGADVPTVWEPAAQALVLRQGSSCRGMEKAEAPGKYRVLPPDFNRWCCCFNQVCTACLPLRNRCPVPHPVPCWCG